MLPHEDRCEVIIEYARRYSLRELIESGTGEGFAVNYLLERHVFDFITTIEISPTLNQRAKDRFKDFANVACLLGDSGNLLANIVALRKKPVLFWLDGHFCGGDTRPPIDTPIREELAAAFTAPKGSVILIDDARLFEGGKEHTADFADYPSLLWVRQQAAAAGFKYSLQDDIMRLTT